MESGDVRGFVRADALTAGDEAAQEIAARGQDSFKTAEALVKANENPVLYFTLTSVTRAKSSASLRTAIISYAQQFVGNPYVWGGTSLTEGADCSGFVQQIYAQFGVTLPRCSYEQAEVGTRIAAKDAQPGDLVYYARDGVVYHVLMYVGDGKAVNAASMATGIVISNVDYSKAVWACSYIGDDELTSTQAKDWTAIGRAASDGNADAQAQIIGVLAKAANQEWFEYGFCRSVLIAQAIQESGWLSFGGAANGGILPEDNNILGVNAELRNNEWVSPWSGAAANRNVPQSVNGKDVYGYESMRTYEDMEACMEDYAAYKIGMHPEMTGVTDTAQVIATALEGYATDPDYQPSIARIIERYDLTRYDKGACYYA